MLTATNIVKDFGGTRALDLAELAVRAGEVHAVVGENGAGKSTLMHIIGGAVEPDAGTIKLEGRTIRPENPHHAMQEGIATVHQHSTLALELSVAENILLGQLPRNRFGFLDRTELHRKAALLGSASWASRLQAAIS